MWWITSTFHGFFLLFFAMIAHWYRHTATVRAFDTVEADLFKARGHGVVWPSIL